MKKQRYKLKESDLLKINARYRIKYNEYKDIPLYDVIDEMNGNILVMGLKTIFQTKKLSSTDKRALIAVVDFKLQEELESQLLKNKEKELIENNIDGE